MVETSKVENPLVVTLVLCLACASIVGMTSQNSWYGIATFLGLSAVIVGRKLQ